MPPDMVQFSNAVLVVASTGEQVSESLPSYTPTPDQLPDNPFADVAEMITVDASQAIADAHNNGILADPEDPLGIADKNDATLYQVQLDAQAAERATAEAEEAKRLAAIEPEEKKAPVAQAPEEKPATGESVAIVAPNATDAPVTLPEGKLPVDSDTESPASSEASATDAPASASESTEGVSDSPATTKPATKAKVTTAK